MHQDTFTSCSASKGFSRPNRPQVYQCHVPTGSHWGSVDGSLLHQFFHEGFFIWRRWCMISGKFAIGMESWQALSSWLTFCPLGIIFTLLHPSYLKHKTGRMWDVLRGEVSPVTWILKRDPDRVRDMRELSCSGTNFKINNQTYPKQDL